MALRTEHELHRRRFSRNLGVGLSLAAFVVLVFLLTVVKITQGPPMEVPDPAAASQLGQAVAGQGASP